MGYVSGVVGVVALALGFLAGLLTFRRSLQWCPSCGETLTCPGCRRGPDPGGIQARNHQTTVSGGDGPTR
jgi:hypothetical protein